MKKTLIGLALLFSAASMAQQTERSFLTGQGVGDTQTWQFYCTDGMNSKKWSKIQVPSQWELQGFGAYSYGRWYTDKNIKKPPMEEGTYRRTFKVPTSWKGKQISIVFEGVMTDTEVLINDLVAGDIHQGGFNRFSYNITDKVKVGASNKIEVRVKKESTNRLVNAAERKADWWIFGGIYRPVYLEAKPMINIERIATNAQADGSLYAEVFTTPLPEGYSLSTTIAPIKKEGLVKSVPQSSALKAGEQKHIVKTQWGKINTWDVENPNMYQLEMTLLDADKKPVHVYTEKIGFRTLEFKPKDGIYVNGTKVLLKGINRHSFHPDGGRTTNRATSLQDALLIKEMNMNAVRFHYAPDKHFMEMCDSLGIFVLSELAGWQNGYDTPVGSKLLKEFVTRDVNHPSIIIWSNGNEGGWNTKLDPLFHEYDPQKRHVIHPWADFDELDTHHYPEFLTGVARFTNGYKVFMPTEFMHGTYDQGHGAGLEDFWNNYTSHPLFAGGFMWDFCDNAVKRTDKAGILDSDGSNGSDGILGPRREKEGSYYAVREIWAPIQFEKTFITPSFKGEFLVKNDYLFTNLDRCTMKYKLYTVSSPLTKAEMKEIGSGEVRLPAIAPKEQGRAKMQIANLNDVFKADVIEIKAWDQHGKEICTWTWNTAYAKEYTQKQLNAVAKVTNKATINEQGNSVTLSANGVSVNFDKTTGLLSGVKNAKGALSFGNGPIAVGMNTKFKEAKAYQSGNDAVFVVRYLGAIDSIQWKMTPEGLISMRATMLNRATGGQGFDDAMVVQNILNLGLTFSYPEEKVNGVQWYGKGPYRVWKNRIKGTNFGLWEKAYNNTITGESFENLIYPEFKGYHSNLFWATLQTKETPFTVYSESDGVFFRLYTPAKEKNNRTNTPGFPEFPEGDISFLYDIAGIRCFKPISQHGPKSQPGTIRIKSGDEGIKMNLWFDFR